MVEGMRYLLASKTGSVVTVARAQGTCKDLLLVSFSVLTSLPPPVPTWLHFLTQCKEILLLNVLNQILRVESHWPGWGPVFAAESVLVVVVVVVGGSVGDRVHRWPRERFPRGKLRLSCQ